MRLYHSRLDDVIPYRAGTELKDRLCALGASVDWDSYLVPTHIATFYAAAPDTTGWLADRPGGQAGGERLLTERRPSETGPTASASSTTAQSVLVGACCLSPWPCRLLMPRPGLPGRPAPRCTGPGGCRYVGGGQVRGAGTSRVISLGAKTRNGGPQKPVPRLV